MTVLATVLAVTQVDTGPRIATVRQAPGESGSTLPLGAQTPTPTPTLPAEVTDPEARSAAIARLLLDRGEAIRRDDAATWRRQQVAAATTPDFANLAVLPITRWTYTVDSTTSGDDATQVTLGAVVTYRLDVDERDAVLREQLVLQHTDTGWRVASERGEGGRAQPWDLGKLAVVRGRSSLVIGIGTSTATLRRYAAVADSVAEEVTAVWGEDWSGSPVIVVPSTTALLARGLGRSVASLERIAAVTTSEGGNTAARGTRAADRVWTNTPVMTSLSVLGREIVIRHETLHAAVGAAATNATPLWLEEGLAEYVGYRGSGVSLRTAAGDLITAVRAGRGPRKLPTPEDFGGARLAEAYESAHVACVALAEKYGVPALVEVYRLTAAGDGDAADNLDAALREVTGQGTASLTALWSARLRGLAG